MSLRVDMTELVLDIAQRYIEDHKIGKRELLINVAEDHELLFDDGGIPIWLKRVVNGVIEDIVRIPKEKRENWEEYLFV
jgi:hypothetical protein